MLKVQDRYGPGIWFMLHLQAAHATTPQEKQCFLTTVKTLADHFPCHDCRKHFNDYLRSNPPENYLNKDKGLFLWTWEFHDAVNKRLGKQSMTFDEAWKQYKETTAICTDDCGDSKSVKHYTIRSYYSLMDNKQ